MSDYHLSLSLGRELWNDMLRAALPVQLAEGEFDLARNTRDAVRQLRVRERVKGLLEEREPPAALVKVKDRAKLAWHHRRDDVSRRLNEIARVEGTWRVELAHDGTEFRYGTQQVAADAWVRGVAEGTLFLLRENVAVPFVIERRLGASVTLGDIRYDRDHDAVIGSLGDLAVHLGEGPALELLARLAEYLLAQQLPRVSPVPILKRDQVEDLVGGLGGALRVNMGVDDLELVVTEDDMILRVRFGFTSKGQLEDQRGR